ncbi:hypothetical protein [Enterococcus wangshanyuanii]|uniref:DUF1642 domain-containing protein n=1 Tax=Enterococcus wangshanyuanii TaxID=2005703 RepID=A0ABQ1PXI0_9ENTE|nr:hypothetical protein [Enterococcus wangshanyuanii]GGD06182.1 hypothetical protein GCM10011573_39490 [Enterococcus wangshanyuanii]
MTEKINIAKLKETAEQLQNIKNGIGTNDNKVKMDAFVALNNLNKVIGRLELACENTPPFAVGEYYFDKDVNRIVKIEHHETSYTEIKYLSDGKLQNSVLYNLADYFDKWIQATAEQIATFKRAEQFAKKGRKLDEFEIYDEVYDELHGVGKVIATDTAGEVTVRYTYSIGTKEYRYGKGVYDQLELIQTAEELQEVENSES